MMRIFRRLWQYKNLIAMLTWRQVSGRYKGTLFSWGWAVAEPLMMLAVYSFVFTIIFKGRWEVDPHGGVTSTALILFMGLITFSVFAEVVNTSPRLIVAQANLVKKIAFPLEVLPIVNLLSALVNALFSLMVLMVGMVLTYHRLPATILLLPLVMLPIIFFSLGCSYFISAIGVFIRDLGSLISVLTLMLRFVTPIFYPVSMVPEKYQFLMKINPLATFVGDSRKVTLWGILPDGSWFGFNLLIAIILLILGFAWFMKCKHAFADVL